MATPLRIRLPALREAEYTASPIVEWLHAMDLVAMADRWGEGFSPWVYETRRALPDAEYDDLIACNAAVSWSRLLGVACHDTAVAQDFRWLSDWLRRQPARTYVRLTNEQLSEGAANARGKGVAAATRESLGDELDGRDDVLARAVGLIRNPRDLKEMYVRTAEAFLEAHLRPRWEADRPLLEEEAEVRRRQPWSGTLSALIERLTGRSVPLAREFETASTVIAQPTKLLGPFVTLSLMPRREDTVLLLYGLRGGARAHGPVTASAEEAAGGFRALGDETRWRILQLVAEREMYAHEIGLQFTDLGQAAVSRHLRYLAAEGLLDVRDVQAKKYYKLNRGAARQLSAQLDALMTPTSDRERKKEAA